MLNDSLSKDAISVAQPNTTANGHSASEYSNGTTPNGHSASNGHHYPDAPQVAITSGTLNEKHSATLSHDSAISDAAIEARGYWTETNRDNLKRLGFAPKQCLVHALVIPLYNWRGERVSYLLRADIPRNNTTNGKPIKYEAPQGVAPVLDVAPLTRADIDDPTKPLLITEGAKKADAAASHGLCCINLSGVHGFRGTNAKGGVTALADWDNIALKGRTVFIAYDSDVTTKTQVESALRRLCAFLQSRGAIVKVIYLLESATGEKTGLDDFFAREKKTVSELFTLARDLEPIDRAKRKKQEAKQLAELQADGFALNDIGNGRRFAAQHGAELRFCSVWGKWAIYQAGKWQPDEHGAADERAKQTSIAMAKEAAEATDDDKRARLLKHAATLTKRASRETMLKDAASVDSMSITPEQFDTDLHLFNVANGTLHLPTRKLRPHNPDDLLTHQSPVEFISGAQCPIWRVCMERWIPDAETRRYLQKLVGVSLSGKVFEELFVFLYGEGDNGKSTFLRVLEWLLGGYGHKTQAETIMQARDKRKPEAPSPDVLALKGARLVTVHEIDSKHTLNATLIKDLTGRDRITARGMFEKRPTTFEPQFTLWMVGNSKPKIEDTSGGMWRRPRLIPFGQPIPKGERDPHLCDKLQAELSGILNWALDGLHDALTSGLEAPEAVQKAVNEYRAEQDPLADFLQNCCVIGENCTAAAGELFGAWEQWSRENGEKSGTARAFGGELTKRKFERYQGNGHKRWRGVGLLSNQLPLPQLPQLPQKPEKLPIENITRKTFSENGVVRVVRVVAGDESELTI